MNRPSTVRAVAATVVTSLMLGVLLVAPADAGKPAVRRAKATTSSTTTTAALGYSLVELSGPQRTEVREPGGAWVATFTYGSRTVSLAGPARNLREAGVVAVVPSRTWVRTLAAPYGGSVDLTWLEMARTDTSPDVLQTALQYVAGASEVRTAAGLLWSSDASYGPLQADGTRQEGSDWNDYQGVTATYGNTIDEAEGQQFGSLDCSGFMRMVWGVRSGLPLSLGSTSTTLPRRAVQMYEQALGTVVVADRGKQVTSFGRLQPGDLVFFDASTDDGAAIDHVGMYLGTDDGGHHRFVSSRKSIDGPTMGDYRGRSTLDGTGLYAKAFRAIRRL